MINDKVLADAETSHAGPQIFFTRPPDMRIACEQKKPIRNRIDKRIRRLDSSAPAGYVIPDVFQIRIGQGRANVAHQWGN